MKKLLIHILIFLISGCFAAGKGIIANEVVSFKPGEGQNAGQSPEYFPENIFTLPPAGAGKNFQAAAPEDVCSIGMGGEIILFFKDGFVIDGEGPDFTVFENAFVNPVTGRIFAEPAKVAVSKDGKNFTEFPFDSLTLQGCAGVNYVNGQADPFNPLESGGDTFDLADIGINKIRYVKITDISSMVLENTEHPFYDPIISGFDLDCVAGVNTESVAGSKEARASEYIFFQGRDAFYFEFFRDSRKKTFELFNFQGRLIMRKYFRRKIEIDTGNIARGFYLIKILSNKEFIQKKVILY